MYTRAILRAGAIIPLALSSGVTTLCEEPSTADRIRGNYENKIRFFANPEKIFETFANIREEDGVFMSYNGICAKFYVFNFFLFYVLIVI